VPEEFELSLPSLVRLRGIALLEALERHAPGAGEHADAVASYAFAAAVGVGFERARADLVREVAKLHEVGLVYVPTEALGKAPGELDEDQRGALALHSESGSRLARGAGIPNEVCEWILRWPERYDGRGPAGLSGGAIPMESRLIHAACACDAALAAPTLAESSRTMAAAESLRSMAGSILDPNAVNALAGLLDRMASPG
jgi:HD-GYP domain-containing protein (c-di-GMP phosphodiesterase class II)